MVFMIRVRVNTPLVHSNDFTGSNPDHTVQSNYIWSQVIPHGTSSFDFDGAVTVPVSGARFRGTGDFTCNYNNLIVYTYGYLYINTCATLREQE